MKTRPHKTGGLAVPCHPQHLILVREGVQCGNCLALVIDRRTPTENADKNEATDTHRKIPV